METPWLSCRGYSLLNDCTRPAVARVAFTSKNGVQNRQTAHTDDTAEDMVKLQIHLIQRFLHVERMLGSHLEQVFVMTPSAIGQRRSPRAVGKLARSVAAILRNS